MSSATHVKRKGKAKFRVLLERPTAENAPRNPFLILDIFNMPPRRVIVREFEVEARSERVVRRLLDEAYRLDLPNVRGFRLRSIEQLPEAAP